MQAVKLQAQSLVAQLRAADSDHQQATAARALVDFCSTQKYSKEWQDAGGEAGVPAALVQAAKLVDIALQTKALTTLGEFVAGHSANRSAAAAAGAIPVHL